MNCLKCGTPIDLARPTCSTCGNPIDADGNGLPDVLDKLVEKKVSKLLDVALRKPTGPSPASRPGSGENGPGDDQGAPLRELQLCRELLAKNHAERRPGWLLSLPRFVLLVALSVGIGGVLLTQVLETIVLKRSLVAATIFCPSTCAGCSGPGKIFTWHVRSTNFEGNVSTQLCTNPAVNVATLTKLEVIQREDDDLRPYRLTLWTSFVCNSVLALPILLLLGPLFFAWLRRRSLRLERTVLELRIRKLEARLPRPGSPTRLA